MSATGLSQRRFGWLTAAVWLLLPLLPGCIPGRSEGERLYRRHCVKCHGADGGGGILYLSDDGANLLDDTWRYGGDRSEIEYSLVSDEVRKHESWEFTNRERQQLVDHILTLRGESR